MGVHSKNTYMETIEERLKRITLQGPTKIPRITNSREPKVYGYIRVSTQEQKREGVGLDVQSDTIKSYCKDHKLGDPDIISEEKGISGTKMENRPNFLKMADDALPEDVIIAYSLSRISRSVKQFLQFVDDMKVKLVRLILIAEKIDINYDNGRMSASSEFMLTTFVGFCQMEASITRERTQGAMDLLHENCTLRTKPCFGYTYVTNEKKERILTPIPEQIEVIDALAEAIMKDKKISTAKLTLMVNTRISAGTLVYKGKPKVAQNQIDTIIRRNNLRNF
jgi:DNA invertase Pin-like site-specific DNA recombinase